MSNERLVAILMCVLCLVLSFLLVACTRNDKAGMIDNGIYSIAVVNPVDKSHCWYTAIVMNGRVYQAAPDMPSKEKRVEQIAVVKILNYASIYKLRSIDSIEEGAMILMTLRGELAAKRKKEK